MDRVEEINAHDAFGRPRIRGNFGDRQGGSIGGQNGVRTGQFSEPPENLFFQFHFLHRRFDDQVRIVQRHFSRARENAVQTRAGFDPGQQVPFHALVVELTDTGHSLGHLFRADVAQNHGQAARTQPMRNASTHRTRSDDRSAGNRLRGRRGVRGAAAPLLRVFLQEKDSD